MVGVTTVDWTEYVSDPGTTRIYQGVGARTELSVYIARMDPILITKAEEMFDGARANPAVERFCNTPSSAAVNVGQHMDRLRGRASHLRRLGSLSDELYCACLLRDVGTFESPDRNPSQPPFRGGRLSAELARAAGFPPLVVALVAAATPRRLCPSERPDEAVVALERLAKNFNLENLILLDALEAFWRVGATMLSPPRRSPHVAKAEQLVATARNYFSRT